MFKRKAEWIYYRNSKGLKECKCSNCKTSYGCMDTPYCPNCGRKMTKPLFLLEVICKDGKETIM